jgi:hypothetical protein
LLYDVKPPSAEAVHRAADIDKVGDEFAHVDVSTLEKVLPQLLLDF